MTRPTLVLAGIVILGGALRLWGAVHAPIELIEKDEFIPAAMTISSEHLPLRAAQHGAVPIYLIKASSLIFGGSLAGLRLLSVIAGTATIYILYLVALRWWGPFAGIAAATLLALDRYHVAISGRAIELPYDLFFIAVAVFMFSRFLESIDRHIANVGGGKWLYGTAIATAFGFLCKELTAIMLPVFLASFLLLRLMTWFKRREPWIAVGLFVLVIGPDAYSNMTVTPAERLELKELHEQTARQRGVDLPEVYLENGLYMTYGDQLSRFRSVGFNITPFCFYFGDALNAVGIEFENTFTEFPFMHPGLAVLLWLGIAFSLARGDKDRLTVFLLTMFVITFVPFALVDLGSPRDTFPSDPNMLWYWVDRSMLPAMLLTGHQLSLLTRRRLNRPDVFRPANPF